jgi:hypothetical protein
MAKSKNTTITYMEPRKMRRATTGLDDGVFYVVKEKHRISRDTMYLLGFRRHANANQHKLKRQYGKATSEHVITKDLYDAFIKEAKFRWKQHAEVVEPSEQMTITKED